MLGAADSGIAVLPICRVTLARAATVPEIVSEAPPGKTLPPPSTTAKPEGSALEGRSAIV